MLRDATRDLHHAAEQHVVGGAMAAGTISAEWWADWCGALHVVHCALDKHVSEHVQRAFPLLLDLDATPCRPRYIPAAGAFAATLRSQKRIEGAAYVFVGAHLFGGEIMRRRLENRRSCHHLRWYDRPAALAVFRPWREGDAVREARDAFSAVLAIMDGIADHAAG